MVKLNKRGQGQRNRRAKEGIIEGLVTIIWGLMKWTIFLPITLLFLIFKKNR